ncbi:beta-lactamase family protein [Janthinobacterium agaricidamnosum NBRC 102515 = DSM 9628]|uniref:Beta-lactamase family protein n=1 Tax=Janthinobacterium agaricidamnosum NBRC 102515 = DSM 9628 TaxID=1349767 RepID=W0UZP8_9BURK|nr:beta-lactamase family protein [Janthinobacterium agaricidamnosum NBRC 102515 = DSM 9628]
MLWKSLAAVVVLLLLAGAAALYWAMPVASGYAAHYLCTQALVAGRDADVVFRREVAPINPLLRMVSYQVDRSLATVRASGLGFIRPVSALYRPGLGCTLMVDTDVATLIHQATGIALSKVQHQAEPAVAGEAAQQDRLQQVLDKAMQEPSATSLRNTQALVVMRNGRLLAERYASGIGPDTPLLGWSMTKTVTALLAGVLVQDGKLALGQDALLPDWSAPADPRRRIQLQNLLQWTSGLDYEEHYMPGTDTTNMLYQSADMAHYVSSRPLKTQPGSEISYNSGSSVLLAKVMAQAISAKPLDIVGFARRRLFEPLGIHSASIEPDAAGNLVGGSYMLASARDWSRIGQLILQQGNWDGQQIVSRDWIRFMSTAQSNQPEGLYGAHLWLNQPLAGKKHFMSLPDDMVRLDGFNHQLVVVIPSRQLVITRLGATVDRSWDTERFVADVLASLPI